MVDLPANLDALVAEVQAQLKLDPDSEWGIPHWRRLYRNALLIAAADERVDREILPLYALLVDSKQEPAYSAMAYVLSSRYCIELARDGKLPPTIDKERLIILQAACIDTPLRLKMELVNWQAATLHACWDAYRLEETHWGRRPRPDELCSLYATPDNVRRHWEEAWNPDDPAAIIGGVR